MTKEMFDLRSVLATSDTVRKCCAIIPANFGHMMKQAARARLDSDMELSGGQT